MTTTPNTVPDLELRVLDVDPTALSEEVEEVVPASVLQRWGEADRTRHRPRLIVAERGNLAQAVALVQARPGTTYLKIVDVVGTSTEAQRAVVQHALELARSEGRVKLSWEHWTEPLPAWAGSLGFVPLAEPIGDHSRVEGPARGSVCWLDPAASPQDPGGHRYYRQSTHFSCGSVVSLLAQHLAGRLASEQLTEEAELRLWRRATNFPACDPFTLAVAVAESWPASSPQVSLDTRAPVMVGHLSESERHWRAVLQQASRDDAVASQIPVRTDRMSLGTLGEALRSGSRAALLISSERMHGFDVPHWVLVHAVTASGMFLLEDPWCAAEAGDTWVDAHLLPVAPGELEPMSVLESERSDHSRQAADGTTHDDVGYRGAVLLS
ncbi:MAG: peptidase C39 family protein [Micrococcaceae bacterium]